MAVRAIPNPKKVITIDMPIELVKNNIERMVSVYSYKMHNRNTLLNMYTFDSAEFASFGAYLDLHINSLGEKTEIEIEIRRKMGTFNSAYEVTKAHKHIETFFNFFEYASNMSNSQVERAIEKKNEPIEKIQLLWMVLLFFFGFVVIKEMPILGIILIGFGIWKVSKNLNRRFW